MIRSYKLLLALAAVLLCATAQATTWDFAGSFSTSNGYDGLTYQTAFSMWAWGIPSGTTPVYQQAGNNPQRWSYATYAGTATQGLFSYNVSDAADTRYTGRDPLISSQFCFNTRATPFASQGLDAYIGATTTGGAKYYVPGQKVLASLVDMPNNQAYQSYHHDCTARWTAAVEGDYTVTVTWTGRALDTYTGTSPVALLVAGSSAYTGTVDVQNTHAATTYTTTAHLLQGQTIDMQLLGNSNGTNGNAYVQMDMVVDAPDPVTPEPGAMLMLGTGLIGLVGFKLRRK